MADEIITPLANDDEYLGMEVKQLEDEEGNDFYPKTHIKAVEGIERYEDGIIGVTNDLIDLANTMIFDTGWKDYSNNVAPGVTANGLYASDGFHCGIRQVLHYYGAQEVQYVNKKMIRVNLRNFTNGQKIAQLPTGFMNTTQVFYSRSGSGKQPIMVEIRANGDMNVYIDKADQAGSASSNWIYAQFEWTE